jgi:hypothetical protein
MAPGAAPVLCRIRSAWTDSSADGRYGKDHFVCLDRRISPADQLAELPVGKHARHFIAECLRLSKLFALEDLRLAAWPHRIRCPRWPARRVSARTPVGCSSSVPDSSPRQSWKRGYSERFRCSDAVGRVGLELTTTGL